MRFPSLSRSYFAILGLVLAALLVLAGNVRATRIDVRWDGVEFAKYSFSYNWLPEAVPNNGNQGNTYGVLIAGPGPSLDIDAVVDYLRLQHGSFHIANRAFSADATWNDTFDATRGEGLRIHGWSAPAKVSLGSLANFNAATSTLNGGVYGLAGPLATLSFHGARIVTNSANLSLGSGARIVNEFGEDALKPLAVNNGVLSLQQPFETAGDFTNNGELVLHTNSNSPVFFRVTGKLTNFDPGTKTLSAGKYVVYDRDDHPAVVRFEFPGADIVTNSAAIVVNGNLGPGSKGPAFIDEQGRDALRNLANNSATGSLTLKGSFNVTAPQFSNAGYMALGGTFALPAGGGVLVQSDGELYLDFQGVGVLDTQGGYLLLQGGRLTGGNRNYPGLVAVSGTTTSNAVIAPGGGIFTPRMVFGGDLLLGSSSVLRFDLAGQARGPFPARPSSPRIYGYDAIDSTGAITLNGKLQVTLSTETATHARFTPQSTDTFLLVKSQLPLSGSFKNVANGARLTTTDGGGSFVVHYGAITPFETNAVVLSDYQPNTGPAAFFNLSTRAHVEGGDQVLIGGFIVTGSESKPVIVRGIGPSLHSFGIATPLEDPTLTLHDNTGAIIASNDDWQQTQRTDIQATGVAPSDRREPAIVSTLAPGTYTAVVKGKNAATGICLVEVYDLDAGTQSRLANISTRGLVRGSSDVMIGGIIVGGGSSSTDVLVRALGPSLEKAGVDGAIEDPLITVYDGNGNALVGNDNWKDSPRRSQIEATGAAPGDDREAAELCTLQPGAYTAVVRLVRGEAGVGLVEFYRLN